MSHSDEFDLPEGIQESDFLALLDVESGDVEVEVSGFPLTLSCQWGDVTSGPDLLSEGSSLDPSFDPLAEPLSDPLTDLSIDSQSSGQDRDEAKAVGEELRATQRTFRSAAELREALQETASTRSTRTSRSALSGKTLAQHIVNRLRVETVGWCRLSVLEASKKGGYIQLSYSGQNKFAALQDCLLWARGLVKGAGEQASHLCDQPRCAIVDHIHPESPADNNARKGCLGHVKCSPYCSRCGGRKNISVCPHRPECVRFCEGYSSQHDFLGNGICHSQGNALREREAKRRRKG